MAPMRTNLLLVVVAVAGWCPSARAEVTAAEKRAARQLLKQGREHMAARRFRQALQRFQAAYRRWPRHEIQFNIALVHLELGDRLAAATSLRLYLRRARPKARETLVPPLKKLLRQVAVIWITVTGTGISAWIDGKRVGDGRAEVVVAPGRHYVEARAGDRVLARETMVLAGGQEIHWQPRIRQVRPGGVGGGKKGGRRRPPGARRVHWAYFAAVSAVAVIAGATLIGTGIKAVALNDEFKKTGDEAVMQRGKRYQLASNLLAGLAGTAALAAGVLLFYTRWRPEEPSPRALRFTPAIAPGGLSVQLTGRF